MYLDTRFFFVPQTLLAQQYQRALALVRTHRDKIDSLAKALLEQNVVHKADLRKILGEKVRRVSAGCAFIGGGGHGAVVLWLMLLSVRHGPHGVTSLAGRLLSWVGSSHIPPLCNSWSFLCGSGSEVTVACVPV